MVLTGQAGRAALAVVQCPTSALVEVRVFRAGATGIVAAAGAVDVTARAGDQEVTIGTDVDGFVCFRLAGMDGDIDTELVAEGHTVRATAVRNTVTLKTVYIGGPYLMWAYRGLRIRPQAAYLREAGSAEELTLELLGEAAALQVIIPDLPADLEVKDRDGLLLPRTERVEFTEDMFGDPEETIHRDVRVAASRLPLRIAPGNVLSSTARLEGKEGSDVSVALRTPYLTVKQRRGRVRDTEPPLIETVTQVIYSADLDVECEVDGVPAGTVNYDWNLGGTAPEAHTATLRHRFAVPDNAGNARYNTTVNVVVTHASRSQVALAKTLRLALPTYHGDLPEITDDYLEQTFEWTATPPIPFNTLDDAPALATIWRDRIGVDASPVYRLRAGAPPVVEGGPGVTALAAIPYNPEARGAARRILGGVVNTNLRAKGLTVVELRAIVGHEGIHLRQHAAARDTVGSLWRDLDDAGVDASSLREIQAHVWEMAQTESHKLLQSTVDYFADFYRKAREMHTAMPDDALKGRVADFINEQFDAIPPYCIDLKSNATGGAFDGAVRRIG